MPYHSSSSTLNVLAFENMLSYAPIRVSIASTGESLEWGFQLSGSARNTDKTNLAFAAGTSIPS